MQDINDAIRELTKVAADERNKIPLPNEELVIRCEKELQKPFPNDLKVFLKTASNISFGYLEPLTITNEMNSRLDMVIHAREGAKIGLPTKYIPFCEDNGDYYCVDQKGKVYFWSHNGFVNETWEDIGTWIKEVWIEESKD